MLYACAQKVCIKLTLEFLDLSRNLCCLRVTMAKSWLEHISAGTPGAFQLKICFCSVLNAGQATQVERRARTSAHSAGTNTHKPARPAQTSSHQALFVPGVTGERWCPTCVPAGTWCEVKLKLTLPPDERFCGLSFGSLNSFVFICPGSQNPDPLICVTASLAESASRRLMHRINRCAEWARSPTGLLRDTTINPSRGATGIIRGRFCPVLPGCCRHLCRVGNSYSGYWMLGAWGVWGVRSGSFILFPFLNSSLESSCGERRVSGFTAAVHNAPCGRAHRGTSAPAKVRLPMGFSHFEMLTQGQF